MQISYKNKRHAIHAGAMSRIYLATPLAYSKHTVLFVCVITRATQPRIAACQVPINARLSMTYFLFQILRYPIA